MVQVLMDYFNLDPVLASKLMASLSILILLILVRSLAELIARRKVQDTKRLYFVRRFIAYTSSFLMILLVGRIWIKGIDTLTQFLGLTSAGLAIAMHDTIANIAGWIYIVSRRPFNVGDRIQVGDVIGDVIDVRLAHFSVIEVRNWVAADQTTGRIVHIPNSKVLREPLANYELGFEYIWNEVPVLITFESDWRKAKQLLQAIAEHVAEHLSEGAKDQIRRAARKYMIVCDSLAPLVFTTVRDSGVLLTIRYMVRPRDRRETEQQIWEAVLGSFSGERDIELAYPTTRFYAREHPASGAAN